LNMKTKYCPTALIISCGGVFLFGCLVQSDAEPASPFSVERTQREVSDGFDAMSRQAMNVNGESVTSLHLSRWSDSLRYLPRLASRLK
jgi:hypothetical protein